MSFQVQGLKEVQEKLRQLGQKTAKKYVRKSLRAGAKPVLSQARSNAPVKTGLVRRSLRIVGGKGRKGVVQVRIVLGVKLYVGKSYYGAFVEIGHFTGRRLKGFKGANAKSQYRALSALAGRKFIPGKHFMRDAADSGHGNAIRVFASTLWELIAKDLK